MSSFPSALVAQVQPPVAPTPVLPSQPLPALSEWLTNSWPSFVEALLVLLVARIALQVSRNWSSRVLERARVEVGTQILVRRTLSIGIVLLAFLTILGILG